MELNFSSEECNHINWLELKNKSGDPMDIKFLSFGGKIITQPSA